MSPRIALLAAAAAASFLPVSPASAAPCVPAAVGNWCYDSNDPTDLPCIEGNFDPPRVRLINCPS